MNNPVRAVRIFRVRAGTPANPAGQDARAPKRGRLLTRRSVVNFAPLFTARPRSNPSQLVAAGGRAVRNRFLLLALGLFLTVGGLGAANACAAGLNSAIDEASDFLRQQVERANDRVEKLRRAYELGAVSKRELEEAEAEARELERRLKNLSEADSEPGPPEARRRVEEARIDHEKAAAKSKKLSELYEAGVVSRNEAESARAAAEQAETYLKLHEELLRRLVEIASTPKPPRPLHAPAGSGLGEGGFSVAAFYRLQDDYFREFQQPLPVSAFGPSETHEKMGFDHEGRVDIALHPDSTEGHWLVLQLELRHIPFVAFRSAVPGKATGPHIHMGFPSPKASSAASPTSRPSASGS